MKMQKNFFYWNGLNKTYKNGGICFFHGLKALIFERLGSLYSGLSTHEVPFRLSARKSEGQASEHNYNKAICHVRARIRCIQPRQLRQFVTGIRVDR